MSSRGIVVAGTHTGVGKTTLATGLMRAFRRAGRRVQPFKVGPDFIDPTHHERASGRSSHNLDGWMLDRATVETLFRRHASGTDLAIVEGVMGLFDGAGTGEGRATTASISRWLGLPVLLVVDCWKLGGSVAPLVEGFSTFDERVEVAGVVLNRTAGPGHEELLRDALDGVAGGSVLGAIPKSAELEIPERHLGLKLADDKRLPRELTDTIASAVEAHVDMEAVESAAVEIPDDQTDAPSRASPTARIGVAYDRAFQFYYRDNFDRLERAGADLEFFSPLEDDWPEELDGLYVGGGYPEEAAAELAGREDILRRIRRFSERGGAIYAECGGLMALGEWLETTEGQRYRMAGIFPWTTRVSEYPRIDYVDVSVEGDAGVFDDGLAGRGHVFHYSSIVDDPEDAGLERVYRVEPLNGEPIREGYAVRRTLASYIHLHFGSNAGWAEGFVEACRAYRRTQANPSDGASEAKSDPDSG